MEIICVPTTLTVTIESTAFNVRFFFVLSYLFYATNKS